MKKALLFVTVLAVLACIFALSVSAAEPSTSDAFGEVTLITDNEALSAKKDYGYSEGDTARIVLQIPNTETYVTYPMYYCYGELNDGRYGMQLAPDFSALNNATGYSFDSSCVIRLEIPDYFTAVSTNYSKTNQLINLKYVKFSENFIYIHSGAFANITALEEIVFESNSSQDISLDISTRAFAGCVGLTSVSFPAHLTSIGERSFDGCTGLETVDVNSRLGAFGTASFIGCSALETLNIPADNSITEIKHRAFEGCSALTGTYVFEHVTAIGSVAFKACSTNEGTYLSMSFPSIVDLGGSSGDSNVFSNSGVCELYFGENLAVMTYNTFSNCSRLWRIEFAGVAEGFEFKSYTFDNCPALKAMSLPKGITVLPSRMFRNCTNLTAVYIPSTVVKIASGANDHATFKACVNMYFVDKPFTYKEVSDIPAEPSVYYFPSGITEITGEAFDGSRVNDVVVMPVGLKSLTEGYTFEGSTSASGMPTVVFLGDMETVKISSWNVKTVYFANSADKDATSVGLSGSVSAVYCYAEGNTTHLKEMTKSTDATCLLPKMTADYCFCGQFIPGTAVTDGDALGHSNTIEIGIVYDNYMAQGYFSKKCDRCGEINNDEKKEALFTSIGVSAKTFGDDIGLVQGYTINRAAIEAYKAYAPDFDFGILAYANRTEGAQAVAPKPGEDKVVDIVFDNMANDFIEVKLIGVPDEFKNVPLIFCAYATQGGKFFYLDDGVMSESIVGKSYNEIVG